jgi:hypothetical protein
MDEEKRERKKMFLFLKGTERKTNRKSRNLRPVI